MKTIIKIICLADNGEPHIWDEAYIVYYDPVCNGKNISECLITSPDIKKALQFDNFHEAMDFWIQDSLTIPRRRDGKPNRPLTAFTVEFKQYNPLQKNT